jgi:hypothetical protein
MTQNPQNWVGLILLWIDILEVLILRLSSAELKTKNKGFRELFSLRESTLPRIGGLMIYCYFLAITQVTMGQTGSLAIAS